MFEIKAENVEMLIEKFDKWAEQISGLKTEVPQQLQEWQTQDMRRKYPNEEIETTDTTVVASTEIWPRSRLSFEDEQRRRANLRALKVPKQAQPKLPRPKLFRAKGNAPHGGRPPPSNRPILREELFTKLHDREVAAMQEAGKWPST